MRKKSQGSVQSKKSQTSVAYKVLLGLVKRDLKLMNYFMKQCLQPVVDKIQRSDTWTYQPPTSSAAKGEYVGLRNPGCICYMNSMMQQFYMIPMFRYNLLCVDDGKEPEEAQYKGRTIDDNILHQMQKLMAHLELSKRQAYNPMEFCFAFKEYDGSPTNTGEQKDAQEFLNVLFDRIENQLKPTDRKYLLQGIFGGKSCSQMVCMACGKIKNKEEDFYNLSLTAKDKTSVYESLQGQVQGDIINDYNCDGCGKKVDLSKRSLIAETPNILIVHLQRIVFNFDTFENDKLNSLLKFPNMLDLKPYSYHHVMA